MASLARPIPPSGPSAPFRVVPATYFRCAMLRPGMGRTAIILTALTAAILIILSLAMADLRIALIALMIIFVAAPMVIALVYFSIALSPEATATTLPHTIEFSADGDIIISYVAEDDKSPVRDQEIIKAADIIDTRLTDNNIVFSTTSGRLIVVPRDSIGFDLPDLIK